MKVAVVFDGGSLDAPQLMVSRGIEYRGIGRGAA